MRRRFGPRRNRVPGSGDAGQVAGTCCGVGVAAVQDVAGGPGDGFGGLPTLSEVSPGPAGNVGEGVATGVQAVRGGPHVRDALGLDLAPPAAGQGWSVGPPRARTRYVRARGPGSSPPERRRGRCRSAPPGGSGRCSRWRRRSPRAPGRSRIRRPGWPGRPTARSGLPAQQHRCDLRKGSRLLTRYNRPAARSSASRPRSVRLNPKTRSGKVSIKPDSRSNLTLLGCLLLTSGWGTPQLRPRRKARSCSTTTQTPRRVGVHYWAKTAVANSTSARAWRIAILSSVVVTWMTG